MTEIRPSQKPPSMAASAHATASASSLATVAGHQAAQRKQSASTAATVPPASSVRQSSRRHESQSPAAAARRATLTRASAGQAQQRGSSRHRSTTTNETGGGGDAGRKSLPRRPRVGAGGAMNEQQLANELGITLAQYNFPELRDPATGRDVTPTTLVPLNELTAWAAKNNQILTASREAIVEIAEKMAADAGFPEDSNKKFWRNLMAAVTKRANNAATAAPSKHRPTPIEEERVNLTSASASMTTQSTTGGGGSNDMTLPNHPLIRCMDLNSVRKIPEEDLQEMLEYSLSIKEFANFFARLPGFSPFIPPKTLSMSELAEKLSNRDVDGPLPSFANLYLEQQSAAITAETTTQTTTYSIPHVPVQKRRPLDDVLEWHKQIDVRGTSRQQHCVCLAYDGPYVHADIRATHLPSNSANSRDADRARAYHERLQKRSPEYWLNDCHDSSTNTDPLYLRSKLTQTTRVEHCDVAVERTNREQWDLKRRLTVALDDLEQRSLRQHQQAAALEAANNLTASSATPVAKTGMDLFDELSASSDDDQTPGGDAGANGNKPKPNAPVNGVLVSGEATIDPIDLNYFDRKLTKYWTLELEEKFRHELRKTYSESVVEKLLPPRKNQSSVSSNQQSAVGDGGEATKPTGIPSKAQLSKSSAALAHSALQMDNSRHMRIQLGPLRKQTRTVFRLKWHATALQRFLMFRKYQREILCCSQAAATAAVTKRSNTAAKQEQPNNSTATTAKVNENKPSIEPPDDGAGRSPIPQATAQIHFVYALVLGRAATTVPTSSNAGYRVSSVRWNAVCPNVIAVSYERGSRRFSDPGDAYVAVFSLLMPEFPKRVYYVDRAVTQVEFCPRNANLLAACTITGEIYLYNIRRRGEQPVSNNRAYPHRHRFNIYALKWTESEKSTITGASGTSEQEYVSTLLSGADDGRVLLWHIEKPELEAEEIMKCRRVPRAVGHGHDKKRKKEALLVKHSKPTCIDVHPLDKRVYLIGTDEGWIHKCSVSYSEQYLKTFNGHRGPVTCVAYNKFDSNIFASTGEDWNIMVWRDTSATPVFMLNITELRLGYKEVVWSPFGSTQLMARRIASIEIWDLALDTLNPFAILRANETTNQQFTSCTYGPMASLFAVGDSRGKVNLFQLRDLVFVPLARPPAAAATTTTTQATAEAASVETARQNEKLHNVLKEAPSLTMIMGNYYSVD